MPRRSTAVRLSASVLALTAALAGPLTACADDGSSTQQPAPACAPPTPASASSTSALPDDLDLGALGTFTKVVVDDGLVNARAVTEGALEEPLRAFSRDLENAGYSVVGSENEVVEADIFFANPEGGLGAVKFIRAGCEDRIVVELFIDQQTPSTKG